MNPPAFQFYVDDFLGGTMNFTDAELGFYARLLCIQWSTGGLPDDDKELLSYSRGGTSLDRVKKKFKKCTDGKLRNTRMEIERKKQKAFRKSRSLNGKKGGRPSKASGNLVVMDRLSKHKAKKSSPSPVSSLLSPDIEEREREQSFAPEIPPLSRKDFDQLCAIRGVPPECGEWFWNTHDGRNWTDPTGQVIRKVEPLLLNALKNWRAKESQNRFKGGKPQITPDHTKGF